VPDRTGIGHKLYLASGNYHWLELVGLEWDPSTSCRCGLKYAARRFGADLIVVAHEPRERAGRDTTVPHMLEFADIPVLVVPAGTTR
jgi:hypothetical protein